MDDADIAFERTQQYLSEAVRATLVRRVPRPSTGICRSCGETIEPERLAVNPHAGACIDCAQEAEAAAVRARRTGAC